MKSYEIWMEGYTVTGQTSVAQRIGVGYGESFNDAVRDFMALNDNYEIEEKIISGKTNWSIWACRLFDNETDARKSFG